MGAPRTLRSTLDRIQRANREINAFTYFCNESKHHCQGEVGVATRNAQPPLKDVLVAVKDNIAVKDMPLTCGSNMLKGMEAAPYDATVVRLLKQAGSIIVGKTNMDEFGMGSNTIRSCFGPTLHPWSTDGVRRSAGGSSGGSAAAVSAGLVPVALGSDTGGSVRLPASYCGVVGFKPSYGRLSRFGLVTFASSLDTVGIIANSVDMVKDMFGMPNGISRFLVTDERLDCLSKSGEGDMTWWGRQPDFRAQDCINSLRIGVPIELFPKELSASAISNVDKCLKRLEAMGATIQTVSLPTVKYALEAYYTLSTIEASSSLARYTGLFFGGDGKDEHSSLLERVQSTRDRLLGQEVKRRIFLGTLLSSDHKQKEYYHKAQWVRDQLKLECAQVFQSVDILISPTASSGPPALDSLMNEMSVVADSGSRTANNAHDPLLTGIGEWISDLLTVPASLAGIPAISIPFHQPVQSGLDLNECIGVQLMGPFGKDEELLQFASLLMKQAC